MGGLTFAEGAVPTVKGTITTRWEKSYRGGFALSIHIPANAQATIYIPKLVQGDFTITESGRRLWPADPEIKIPGVFAVQQEDSSIKCLAGSGTYRLIEAPLNV